MLKKLAFFLSLFSVCSTASVKAQTIVPADDGTGTIITRDGKRITIDGGSLSQNGENLFHSFQEFGLSPEQIANFLANPQLQNILSRVTGGNPSVIRGLIEVSGGNPNLYLMNPSGVIFGENARLNVPSDFTATTATGIGFKQGWFNAIGENNYSELVGTPNQFIFNTETPSAIINAGDLEVSAENNLSFFAGSVANTGTLTAKQGNITITAVPGKNLIRLSQPGQILSLEIVPPDTTAGEWNLSVYDLPALLTGDYSPEGLVVDEATATVSLQETSIPTTEGSSVIAGELDVSGETGGNIYVLGEKIGLYEAQLSADGINGGGEIFVGGDYQGGESLPSAARTFVSDGAELSADALLAGDGGQVIVWSEGQTVFSGDISAKGGKEEGNGGFVEVSGKEALAFNGTIDVSASQGETGTVLFDPRDIIIEGSPPSDNDSEISDGEILFTDGDPETDFFISDIALTSLDGNIILQASRDIIANAEANLNFENQTSGESITFTAERNLEINTNLETLGATVDFTANTGSITVQNISTNNSDGDAGNITLDAGGSIDVSNLTSIANGETGDGGNISLDARDNMIVGTAASRSQNATGNAGSIQLDSQQGNITATLLESSIDLEESNGQSGNITVESPQGSVNINQISTGEFGGVTGSTGNTGNIEISALNQVQTDFLSTYSGGSGDAGTITINSENANVTIGAIDTGSSDGNGGSGGDVTVNAQGNIQVTNLNASSDNQDAGNVTLDSAGGSVDVERIDTFSPAGFESGAGGDVTVNAEENIQIGSVQTFSENAGNVELDSAGGSVEIQEIESFGNGSGGNVDIEAQENITVTDQIETFSDNRNAGNVTLTAGGFIDASRGDEQTAENFDDIELDQLTINASSEDGNGGEIILEAGGNINAGFIESTSENGNGGDISLTSTGGDVNASYTVVAEGDTRTDETEVGLIVSGSGEGNGGNITINARGNIRTGVMGSGVLGDGTGGKITLNSETGSIDTTVGVRDLDPILLEELGLSRALAQAASASSVDIGLLFSGSNEGVGGDVEITAQDNINTGMIITGTLGEAGGDVTLTSNEGSVNTAFDAIVDGVTEELLLEADVDAELASLLDGVSIRLGIITFSEEAKGGDVTINANGGITTSNITTGSFRGEGGNITLNSENGSIDGSVGRFLENVSAELLTELDIDIDSDLMTIVDYFSEEGIGGYLSLSIDENAGNINLSAEGDITTNYLISSSFSGQGGNLILDTEQGAVKVGTAIFNAAQGILPGNLEAEGFEIFEESTTANTTILSTGQELGLTLTLPEFSTESSVAASGFVTRGEISENTFNFAYVIDVSGSMSDLFQGEIAVGDLNNDGEANTLIDGAIASFESLHQSIIDNGFSNSTVTLIPFSDGATTAIETTVEADLDNNNRPDVVDSLRSLSSGGGTNFDAALQEAINFFSDASDGNNQVFFVSDGIPNDVNFFDEADTLRDPNGINADIRAIGLGTGASLPDLDALDDGLTNNSAQRVLNPDELTASLTASPVEAADIARLELAVNGNVVTSINGSDLESTPFGLQYNTTLSGIDPALNNEIEATVIATDGASSNVSTSQVVESSAAGSVNFPDGRTPEGERNNLEVLANLVSGGNVNASGAIGGEIQIGDVIAENVENAAGEISAGAINSSGRVGDGGDMTLASDQDIEVSTLNAQAGINGTGGIIDVTTDEFFRATGTFLDQNETLASISNVGGEGGGEITIRHGGRGETPFIVGDAEVNGTAGEITSGEFEIADGSFLFTEREGNISIISVEEDQPNPEVLNEEPTTTITTNTQQSVQVTTLDDAQEILAEIDRASGVKPALIYLNFTPETLTGITDFQRQEARFTQDYEQYFNLSQRKADVTLSVPRQPDDQLEILLVTESGEPFRITVENATREQVEQTAEALYGSISSPPSPFARQAKPYLAPAQQLYDWIIEPLEATLEAQKIENLVFIMPSGLRLLPVAALHDGEQFLVENYSTGFSPSLSLTDTRYKNLQDLEVFAIGASNFNDPTALGPLPAVELELPTIANEIWRGEFQINDEFTLENFRQERRRNPEGIIHLATHADFRPGNLEDIYIQLYDRKLSLEDIRQLNLNDPPVELLVLSACRTAVGNEQVELGFAGLTVQAGVKSALGSLWYVGDTGTLGLMSEFYRQLNTAPIKAEAIQQAQINLINGEVRLEGSEIITPRGELTLPTEISTRAEDLSHPFYWAAFSLVGSPW